MTLLHFRAAALVLILSVIKVHANLPEDPTEYSVWESKMLKSIETQRTQPNNESIPRLGELVMQMALSNNLEKGDRPVFHAAQLALLTIPGHAEYYRDRVLKAQADFRDNTDGNLAGTKYNGYITERRVMLETLGQLPSPETVRVLGELLSDDWIDPSLPRGYRIGPMSLEAVLTFAKLPIASKPANTHYDHEAEGDLQAWQSWYAQIKTGTRSFRFIGDPREYTLDGPASGELLKKIERNRKRDEEREGNRKKSSSGKDAEAHTTVTDHKQAISIVSIVAAVALGCSLVWYFGGKRLSHRP